MPTLTFTPHDKGTFLVESRTEEGSSHIVDIEEKTCSCKGFEVRKTCEHLTAALEQANGAPTLELAPVQPGEPALKQLAPFDSFKAEIEKLKATAETITVTDSSQVAQMKLARAARLSLKDIRVQIIHRHKECKEEYLREGRKLDAAKNELLEAIEPLELRLKEQEEFIEREEERKYQERKAAREAEITPFLTAPLAYDIGLFAEDRYQETLRDAKDAHEMRRLRAEKEKEEAEAKAEKARIAQSRSMALAPLVRFIKSDLPKMDELGEMTCEAFAILMKDAETAQQADADERERQKVENARLKKEAKEREAALKAERAKAEAERVRLDQERQKAAEEERKKREAEYLKLQAERQAAAEEAKKEQDRLAEIARQEREAREKLEHEAAARKAAEAKAEADRLAAIEAATLAPDKEKLMEFARAVRAIPWPQMKTNKGIVASRNLVEYTDQFTTFIEALALKL